MPFHQPATLYLSRASFAYHPEANSSYTPHAAPEAILPMVDMLRGDQAQMVATIWAPVSLQLQVLEG